MATFPYHSLFRSHIDSSPVAAELSPVRNSLSRLMASRILAMSPLTLPVLSRGK